MSIYLGHLGLDLELGAIQISSVVLMGIGSVSERV